MNAESPEHIVTSPNDDVSFSIPRSSATMIDQRDTNTAEKGNVCELGFFLFFELKCLHQPSYPYSLVPTYGNFGYLSSNSVHIFYVHPQLPSVCWSR